MLTVPTRRLARCISTTSCSSCLLTSPPKSAGSIDLLAHLLAGGVVNWYAQHGIWTHLAFGLFGRDAGTQALLVCRMVTIAAVGAGDRPPDQQQVVGRVDPDDLEVPHRDAGVAELARLADALAGPRRVGAGARRARVAVHPLDAVGGPQAAEAVPLDDAREAPALARADDVDVLDLAEHLDRQGLPSAVTSAAASWRISRTNRLGSASTFLAWPRSAWVALFRFLSANPSWTRVVAVALLRCGPAARCRARTPAPSPARRCRLPGRSGSCRPCGPAVPLASSNSVCYQCRRPAGRDPVGRRARRSRGVA